MGDYLKFIRMMLNHGRSGSQQVLKPETIELMSHNAMGECRVSMLGTVSPALSHDSAVSAAVCNKIDYAAKIGAFVA